MSDAVGVESAASPLPVLDSLSTELPADVSAVLMARVWIRTCLAALGWNGPILRAAEVISRLVDNGVRHGMPNGTDKTQRRIVLRVTVNEAGELVIDVTDLNPTFPNFAAAVKGEKGLGLWHVAHHDAQVTWFLHHEGPGKTVRATLAPGPVDP
jgi:anti-sigma regulatory factor (Ser/Thr protein kinase)